MSDTPRTDTVATEGKLFKEGWYSTLQDYVAADFARQLERELNALRQDAERYRWLRERLDDCAGNVYFKITDGNEDDWVEIGQNSGAGLSLDSAIDSAMKGEKT